MAFAGHLGEEPVSLIDRGPISEQFKKDLCSHCEKRWARYHLPYVLKETKDGWKVIEPPVYLCMTCKRLADKRIEDTVQRSYEEIMEGNLPRVLVIH